MESEVCVMLKEYDFSNARKNPYAKALKNRSPLTLTAIPLITSRSRPKWWVSLTRP